MIIKLRNRLLAAIMAFVSVILLAAFISLYMVTYLRTAGENREKLNSAEVITISSDGQMILEGKVITDAVVVNRISPSLGVYFNLVMDSGGELKLVDSALNLSMEEYELAAAMAFDHPGGGTAGFADRKWQYAAAAADQQQLSFDGSAEDFSFVRFLDVTDSHQTLETLALTLLGLYAALLLVFFFLARFFANRSIRPMAEAWENQRQFVADASHELKTPISTLNANLDILDASREDTVQSQLKWVVNSKKVLSRMTSLIQSMLELAGMDENTQQHTPEDVNLNDLLDEAADSHMPPARKKNITITEDIGPGLHVHSNYGLVRQIADILMDNAVQYTDEGGAIHISARKEKGNAVITIENTGDGISPADMDKVFDRFYRGDKARVYGEGNYGLGLSIAKSAAQKLEGRIEVQSGARQTRFTLTVPNRKPHRPGKA